MAKSVGIDLGTTNSVVAVMQGGHILQLGSPRDIYERPSHLFVADFIGEINLLNGHAEAGGARALVGFAPVQFEGFQREVGEPAPEREARSDRLRKRPARSRAAWRADCNGSAAASARCFS